MTDIEPSSLTTLALEELRKLDLTRNAHADPYFTETGDHAYELVWEVPIGSTGPETLEGVEDVAEDYGFEFRGIRREYSGTTELYYRHSDPERTINVE